MKYTEKAKKAKQSHKGKSLLTPIKTWKGEGETLTGKVLKITEFTDGKFKSKCKQYLFDTDEGQVSTVFGASVDKALSRAKILNHVLHITYNGKMQLDDGRQCNKFEILDITNA